MSRFFLTTAIDYVNSRPHLGTAYEKVCSDVIARYQRMKLGAANVWFLMGNDEHSQNVYRAAVEQGLDPVAYCDRMEEAFRVSWKALDLSFDDFVRTTQPRHRAGVTELAKRIYEKGDIYEGVYEGWYCVGCEAFKQEKDLVDGRCPLHPKTEPQWIKEKNYFFKLKKYEKAIRDHIAAHPEFIQPEPRRNEIVRLLEGGLEDISVSRAGQSWGIPLPFDPQSVVYVWFDALINYMSAVGLGTDPAMLARWWPADLHVIGKDITRFHTVIWPAMLMSGGYELPRQVFGHGFMTVNGQRMSKSLGTAIDPVEAAARFGADPLRLYLVKQIPFGGDGDFTWDRYDEIYNADLANNLGNLVSRVTSMAHRYFGGTLSAGAPSTQIARVAEETAARYRQSMDSLAIHEAAAAVFRLIDATNLFIADTAPWTLVKSNKEKAQSVLFDCAEAIRLSAVLLSPVMPASSREILRRVGASAGTLDLARDGVWRADGERSLLQEGALWPRHETKDTKETIHVSDNPEAAAPAAPAPAPAAAAPAPVAADSKITIDDFMKVELRVAKVLAAERVPKSNKLVKLQVDVGSEQRQLVAGIAEAYEPDALVGRTVVIVFNLKPAKLMGVESNGMVLAASPDGGKPMLVGFENPPDPGTRVR
ncbi:MAG TPA: methionine--tRNA ligase [Vicinamibacterales bacterium]|nr:methionine--tRNA ligase [Vicinamibacterales bacterium]